MARLIRPLRTLTCRPTSSFKFAIPQIPTSEKQVRSYIISDMRKSAFEGNMLRLLRNEIQYELHRSPPNQPVPEFNSFAVDNRPGEPWISLKKKIGANEDIKLEATMFDGSVPFAKPGGTGSGTDGGAGQDMQLHISMIVSISKGKGGDTLEIMCSVWPDTIEINKLFVRKLKNLRAQTYTGPEFKELDDKLQDSIYEFLEARGINDDLAVFLHSYMRNKDKTEFIKWMETMISYIEKKKSS